MVTLPIRRGLRNGCGIADRFMTTKQCWSRTFRHRTEGAADSRLILRTSSPIRSERNSVTIRSFIPTVVLTGGFRRRQPIPCLPAVLVARRLLDIRPATEIYSGRRTRVSLNLSTTTAFWVRAISTCWAAECFANRAITTGRTVITTTTTIITRRHLRPTTTFGRISNSIRSNSRLHSSWAISDRNSHRPSIRPATTITTCPVIRPLSSTTTSFPTFETLPTSIKTTATDQDDVLGRKTIDDATLCLPVVLLSSFYSLSPHFVDNSSVLFRKWVDVYKHSTTIVARLATDLRPHHPSLSVSSSSCSIQQQNNNNPALAVLGAAISLWSSLLFQLDRFPSSHLHRAYHEKQINKIQIKVIIIIAGLLFYFIFFGTISLRPFFLVYSRTFYFVYLTVPTADKRTLTNFGNFSWNKNTSLKFWVQWIQMRNDLADDSICKQTTCWLLLALSLPIILVRWRTRRH